MQVRDSPGDTLSIVSAMCSVGTGCFLGLTVLRRNSQGVKQCKYCIFLKRKWENYQTDLFDDQNLSVINQIEIQVDSHVVIPTKPKTLNSENN